MTAKPHVHPWRTRRRSMSAHGRFQVIEELVDVPAQGEMVYTYARSTHDLVAVLAVTDAHDVLLAHTYHPSMQAMFDTLLSGRLLDDEVPSQAARRLLYAATRQPPHAVTPLGRVAFLPDDMLTFTHLFFAPVRPLTEGHSSPWDGGELIALACTEALQRTLRGTSEDGALQLALLLALHYRLI